MRLTLLLTAFWGPLALSPSARAQEDQPQAVDAQHFRPTPPGEPLLWTGLGSADASGSWGASVLAHYAHEPLIWYHDIHGRQNIVGALGQLDLSGSFSLGRLRAALVLPVVQYATSDVLPSRAGIGDLWLEGRITLFDQRRDALGLGLVGGLELPTRTVDDALSTGSPTGAIRLHADRSFGSLLVAVNLGVELVPEIELGKLTFGDAFLGRAGLMVPVGERLELTAETALRASLSTPEDGVPVELLGGFRRKIGTSYALRMGAGTGITAAAGSPIFRLIIGVDRLPQRTFDPDNDGIVGLDDVCPYEPELVNDIRDLDGCPEDEAELAIELASQHATAMVPPTTPVDTDKDGLLDHQDICPQKAEDHDGFEDADGCPEPDNDEDGILDAEDRCPDRAETVNSYEDEDGCPDELPQGTGELLEFATKIAFQSGSAVILPESMDILNEVTSLLRQHPTAMLRIEGHTDDLGSNAFNVTLSEQRTASILRWLEAKGIEAGRLQTASYGETHPIDSNATEAGRARNRRVELYLVDGDPP